MTAKLEEIIEAMELQSDQMASYLKRTTGKLVTLTDEDFGLAEDDEPSKFISEWQRENVEIAREVARNPDNFISLPSKFDIHEYRMIERFCSLIDDETIRDEMYVAIKGRGAFRAFKSGIRRYGIDREWEEFKSEQYKAMAIEWCEENGLEYTIDPSVDRLPPKSSVCHSREGGTAKQ